MNPMILYKFIGLTCLIASVAAANLPRGQRHVSPSPSQVSAQAVPAPGSAADVAAKAAAQQAKLHYVEIGPSLKGDYKFGYDTGSGPAGQSFREESRLDDGTVKGAYGYVDANGKQRIVKYTAGKNGFVVENDAEVAGQGGSAAAAPQHQQQQESVRRPQPASLPQPSLAAAPQPARAQFDEQPEFNVQRAAPAAVSTAEDRARAEREHAEGLRQHQLAQQAALEQQQRLAQQLHLQQQQILASQPRQQSQQQVQPQFGAAPQQQQQQQQQQFAQVPRPQQQFPQPLVHQQIDPQTGSFFSSSTDSNLNQVLANQFRQLQQGNQFAGQFPQPPQAAPQFGPQQPQVDFGQLRAARQAAPLQFQQPQQPHQHQQQAQAQQPIGPQSVLAALHQQQQQDAQMLMNLRAQQAARLQQEQARQAPQPQQARLQQAEQLSAEPAQRAPLPRPQFAQSQLPQSAAQATATSPQPEVFGPPVIDIRTLNYSIGQQNSV